MKRRQCSRLGLIEAVRDGRAQGIDRSGFDRHVKLCPDCSREARELDRLGDGLRRLFIDAPDDVSVRRQRQRMIEDLNAAALRGGAAPRWQAIALAIAAVFAVVVIVGTWAWRHARTGIPAVLALAAPATVVDVEPTPGTRWSEMRGPTGSRVELYEGALRLSIKRATAQSRVAIVVPDGEIDDAGTVFYVSVKQGRTERVSVEQGSVVVRLQSTPALRLVAGESWTAPAVAATDCPVTQTSNAAPTCSAPSSPSSPLPGMPRARTRADGAREELHGRPPQRAWQPDGGLQASAESDLEAARAEDLAYLRVVSLLRFGKAAEGRAAARDYLLRFPAGFRRREVLDVATAVDSGP